MPPMLQDLEDVLIRADLGVAAAARIKRRSRAGPLRQGGRRRGGERTSSRPRSNACSRRSPRRSRSIRPASRFVILRHRRQRLRQDHDDRQARRQIQPRRPARRARSRATRSAPRRSSNCGSGASGSAARLSRAKAAPIAAGLGYDALKAARERDADILIMDTAGRLQNRTELMAELEKIIRVMKKLDPEAPHAVLLVLDATVGQNAMSQVEIFGRSAGVTGLVMTKLDGTARGGILVAIAEKYPTAHSFHRRRRERRRSSVLRRARLRPRHRRARRMINAPRLAAAWCSSASGLPTGRASRRGNDRNRRPGRRRERNGLRRLG